MNMKKIVVLFFVIFAAAGISFAADPVEGFWISMDEKTGEVTAGWHIYAEGGKLYGKILSMTNKVVGPLAVRCKESYPDFPVPGKVNQLPLLGTPWIYGLSASKSGEWSGGSIVNAEDGRIYKCKIIFRRADGKKFLNDVLEMRGEIGLGIGRSQYWHKTDRHGASSL